MPRRGCSLIALVGLILSACGTASVPGSVAEPDLATARRVTWINTAQELAGTPATSRATKAAIYGFGDSGYGGATSVASGDLVLSAVSTDRAVTVVGQSAKTGDIRWRRHLPVKTRGKGYAECDDDNGGPFFACKVVNGTKQATLWMMSDRTGAVRTKIPVKPDVSFGMSGDDLYLATFRPVHKDTRLDVSVERRSWTGGSTQWRRKTSFSIEGWGHDGSSGFLIGADRVVAFSASWEVILDRETGRLLERSDSGRYEYELKGGGRVVVDSGDGTSDSVQVTIFAADGRPIADATETTYPEPYEVEPDRVVTGRHIISAGTGRVVFVSPRRTKIIAVADSGRVAITEPEEIEFAQNEIPLTAYDVATGKRTGAFALKGNWSGDAVTGGAGVAKVVQHYDDKSDKTLPPTIHVIDVRKPGEVAVIRLGKKRGEYDTPTLVRTRYGVAVTGAGAVRGLVAR